MFRRLTPPQLIIGSFLAAGLVGTVLLSLPVAAISEPLPWVDALFTAVSALCVTGLTVIKVGQRLTLFGQLVVLILIQAGGLGLMTFSVVFLTALGRRLSFRDRAAVQESLFPLPTGEFASLIKSVVLYTVTIEAVGALVLALQWRETLSFPRALYYGIFHAVSAFSNAGFSLFPNNLEGFRGDIVTNITVTGLLGLGGVGFFVLVEIKTTLARRFGGKVSPSFSLHAKVVLVTTLLLLITGFIGFYVLERNNVLAELPLKERVLAAYFQGFTPRTAGFNTVDFGRVAQATLLFTAVLMYIGASPGSTGGGIKTATAGILFGLARARLRGEEDIHLFRRNVAPRVVERAVIIASAHLMVVLLGTMALVISETGTAPYGGPQGQFLGYLFEVVSALGTVGLSTGITPGLTTFGKLLIAAIMLAGRVGPLTIALAMGVKPPRAPLRYAEERVMVG